MSKREIKSVLHRACAQIWQATTTDDAKCIIITCLKESHINDNDKKKMIQQLQKLTTLVSVQQYFANALLKYEGDGVI